MRIARLSWAIPVALGVLALVPATNGFAPNGATTPVHPSSVPTASTGNVTPGSPGSCKSNWDCSFTFNSTSGSGWARGIGCVRCNLGYGNFSFQLPGEAKASYDLSYITYIAKLTGTYTYWTTGSFLGTDANTGKVVYGATNTNYTITAHCRRGCYYTYATDNGTAVVWTTNFEQTKITVSCSPATVRVGSKTSCSAKVSDLWNASHTPPGKVQFSSGYMTGAFSNKGSCSLTAGQCSFTWKPYQNTCGSVALSANYPGTMRFYKSSESILITVKGGC